MKICWSVSALVAPMVFVAACRSSPASKPEGGDVMVPKMPNDAAASASANDASGPVTGGGAQGWYLDGEQMQPQYVDRAIVIGALRKAPQRVVAIVDEKIEECSGAGGSHVLFKTSAGSATLHFGGHGTMLQVGFAKGEVYVAGYDALAAPESIKNDGFCVPDRKIDGRITALLPVKDKDEGAKVLDELAH